jgi:hypothetical protein
LALAPTAAAQIVVLTLLPVKDDTVAKTSPIVEAADLPKRIVTGVPTPRPKPAIETTP